MAHYALSELLIVLAGIWAAPRLYRAGRQAAGLAVALFSIAAAFGVVRFGLADLFDGLPEALATPHRLAGTVGGTIAMAALVYEMRAGRAAAQNGFMLFATLSIGLAISVPPLAVAFFLVYGLAFVVLVARHADDLGRPPLIAGAMAGLMLVNVLVFRQAAWLPAAVSWHVFHVLVAVWLVALGLLLSRNMSRKQVA